MASQLNRRSLLTLTGAAAVGALSGCLSRGEDESSNEERTDDNDDDGPLTDYPYTASTQIVDLAEQGYESTLRTVDARHELVTEEASGGPVTLEEVWAFKADDGDPSVPGPIYCVPEGETVELTYQNDHDHPHTLHVHAVDKSWIDDGAPETSAHEHVHGGDSHTYEIHADVPGPHLYHCHVQTDTHLDMGMYGIFYVIPADADPVDREYFLTIRDWDTRLHDQYAGGDANYETANRDPDAFTVNGRSAPSTFHPEFGSPLIVGKGESVRLHVVNTGYDSHSFHTHRHRFRNVAKDGGPIPEKVQHEEDVIDIAPAERYTLEFDADSEPGIYPVHCHKVDHVTTEGSYPGGMLTAIVYEEAMETDEFDEIMDDAGFDQFSVPTP